MDKEDLRTAVQRMDTYQFGQKKELSRKLSKVTSYVTKQEVLEMVSQLDKQIEEVKSTLPVVPQFVADFITEIKPNFNIRTVFTLQNNKHEQGQEWALDNPDAFARAWLDGYTIEKEPAWTVKLDNGRYVDNFVEFAVGIQIDITSKLDCTAPIRFKNKAKAEAVALLVNGTVDEVSE